ncbi:MAG: HNH endonuclease [Clostridia bacterium]|nr:HNH endonuclease [Clostridia bacterium]
MDSIDELMNNESIKKEYKITVLLTMFKKLCIKMKNNPSYQMKVQNLFRQTHDKCITARLITEQEFGIALSDEESQTMSIWLNANLRKKNQRNASYTSLSAKKELYKKQEGICAACGEQLGTEWSRIHVDHIVPFVLVGDELENNYQVLCETCNECKSAKVNYVFSKMIKIY